MTKVVINDCYGGYSLSPAGMEALLERKGQKAYHYANARKPAQHSRVGQFEGDVTAPDFDRFVRWRPGGERDLGIVYTFSKDLGDEFHKDDWPRDDSYVSSRDDRRDDPDLVAIVEELGQAAWGAHAALKVVEVPDGVQWQIEEYDGVEWVSETHRTWR